MSERAATAAAESSRSRAIVEADGWLFDEGEEEEGGVGRARLNEADLKGAVAGLVDNARRCAELGIGYVPALVPSKREALSGVWGGQRGDVGEGLRARLRDVEEVELVELVEVLRDAGRHGALYQRTDAGWNDRGAFFVARALLKEAGKREPGLRLPGLGELHLLTVDDYRGTLADATKLERAGDALVVCEREVEAETALVVDASRRGAVRMPVERHLAQAAGVHVRVYARAEREEGARWGGGGDGAALSLMPWLAESASRTTFWWARELPMMALELELPGVVLHLLREGDLRRGGG
jgi:hypothetical protein